MRRCKFLVIAGVLLLASGCQGTIGVALDIDAGGSGELRVDISADKAAAAQMAPPSELFHLDDLIAAGWEIDGPHMPKGGGFTMSLRRKFASIDEARLLLASLGPPFAGLLIEQQRNPLVARTSVQGAVDLSEGLESFSDAKLEQLLGSPLGVEVADLEAHVGSPASDWLSLTLVTDLPGKSAHSYALKLGERTAIREAAKSWRLGYLWFVVATIAVLVLLRSLTRGRARVERPRE